MISVRPAILRNAVLFLAFALCVLPGAVAATTSTATLTATASIAQNCTIGAATLAFGAYDPVVANRSLADNVSQNMVVTCTKGATSITLGMGNSANAPAGCTAPQRCLQDGSTGHYLNYQLYSDTSRTLVWTTAVAETISGGITTPTNVPVYGQIPGGQDASVGAAYADSVTATVNF